MKNKDPFENIFKKVTKNIKDYAPSNITITNIREQTQIQFPETSTREYNPFLFANSPFPEWPDNEEEIHNSLQINKEIIFTDPTNNLIIFPYSMRRETSTNTTWLRISDYIKQRKLYQEINTKFPNIKNINELKNKINVYEYYNSEKKPKIERRNTIDNIQENKDIPICLSLSKKEKEFEEYFTNEIINKEEITVINKETNTPSNINMSRYYCTYCKWLASLYQIIIDNSLDDKKGVFNCIYPKDENNLPIYNPSGQYWIKLYHMGKFRKIEIDDLIPCNKNNNFETFFPECENYNEIWPFLITKALMKLYSYKYRNDNYENEEVGDCSIIYSLLQYLGNDIDKDKIFSFQNKEQNSEKENIIYELLSDDNYKSKNKLLIAYTPSNSKPKILDNFSIKKVEQDPNDTNQKKTTKRTNTFRNLKLKNQLSFSSCLKLPKIDLYNRNNVINTFTPSLRKSLNNIPIIFKPKSNKKLDNGIYLDCAYTVIEIFSSQNFNMKRLRPINFSDLKLDTNKKYKQMNVDEKNVYKVQIQELRKKQKSELKVRMNDFISQGDNIYLIKFSNQSLIDLDKKIKMYQTVGAFTSEEMEMAKFCLVNQREFPPSEYFTPTFVSKIFKDEETGEINFWTQKFYEKKILKLQKILEQHTEETSNEVQLPTSPCKRDEGCWTELENFQNSFNKFTVLTNCSSFTNKLVINNVWYNFEEDLYEENESSKIIKITKSQTENVDEGSTNKIDGTLFLLFEPNAEKNNKSVSSELPLPIVSERIRSNKFDDIIYSLNINIYSVSKEKELKKYSSIIMKKLFSPKEIQNLDCENDYLLIIKGGIVPFGYVLNFFSNDFQFEQYSYSQFLADYKNFTNKKIQISHPNLPKKVFYVISRIRISSTDEANGIVKFYMNYLNYEDKYVRETMEIFIINSKTNKKKTVVPKEIISIDFSICDVYYIEISLIPSYDIPSRSFEFEISYESKPSIVIEPIQLIMPFSISQQYIPNKHAILFNECMYPTDLSVATLDISVTNKDKEPLPFDVKLTLEFCYNDVIIFSKMFINRTIIRNLAMNGKQFDPKTPNNNVIIPYILKCYLDINENVPYLFKISEYQNDVFWNISVFSTDPILFVKNTQKEDRERELIESWEKNQPGRADLAKVSRKKYFLNQKRKNGGVLSDEEVEFLDGKKVTIESNSDMIITNIPPINQMNGSIFNFNKKGLPNAESYNSIFIRNFYIYSTGERVIIMGQKRNESLPNLNIFCRSEEEKQKEKEKIEEMYNEYYNSKKRQDDLELENCKNYESEIDKMLSERNENRKKQQSIPFEKMKARLSETIKKMDKLNEKVEIMEELYEKVSNNLKCNSVNFQEMYSCLKNVVELKNVKKEYNLIIENIISRLSTIKESIINQDMNEKAKNKKELLTKHLTDIEESLLKIKQETIENVKSYLQIPK